ncbi:MAG: hypothetical protein WCW44_00850 [archaeon]
MNNKGLLFTVMTLFLGITLLSSIITLEDISRDSFSIKEIAALSVSSERFNNISNQLIDLDKTGYAKNVMERTLPFEYGLNKDSNSLTITQQFPFSQAKYDAFFDAINIADIFFSDQNRLHAFDGLIIDINSPKNSAWGGSKNSINFLINPFCYEYIVNSSKEVQFSKSSSTNCSAPFTSSSIKRIDINILVNSGDDYNSLLCNGSSCPQTSFNPLSSNPYYKITVIDTTCTSCNLSQKTASAHFNAGSDFNVTLACIGPSCTSTPVIIKESSLDFNISNTSGKIKDIITTITFNNYPSEFFAQDINLSVLSQVSGNLKSTQ